MTSVSLFLRRALATTLAALLALVGLAASPAHAADAVASYVVTGNIAPDGSLAVQATITPQGAPKEVVQRFATRLNGLNDTDYRFTLSGVKASINGADAGASVTSDGDYQVVRIPTRGEAPIVLDYTVTGAAFATGDTTTVQWRLLQGLNLPVTSFDATLKIPGLFTMIDCAAGPPAHPGACGYYAGGTHEQPDPLFHDGPRGAGEVVQVVVAFPSATVAANQRTETRWSLNRAFSVAPLPLGLATALALLGGLGLWALHRRVGRDAVGAVEPALVGSFRPVGQGQSEFVLSGDVRPGEVGTLVDERVDPIDVTASVLDLAVRNHLRITQLPRASEFAPTEWEFARTESAAALLPYERTLLDVVAPASGVRRLSEVGPALLAALPDIQSGLYDEVVRQGWFAARPDATRGRWSRLGWIALAIATVIAAALIAVTTFGLAGLVLVALAAGVGLVAQAMPARTASGAATLAGLGVLRGVLATQPTDEMPRGREHEELAQVLPYAVVLGSLDRWLAGLAAADNAAVADETELSWFHGPQGWRLADLPDSLRSFVRAFQGTLVAR